jgi:hypothetical protein
MMPGGFNQEKDADSHVQEIIDQVKDEIVSQAGVGQVPHLKAVKYRTQVVAGTNYIVKCEAGNQHLHVKIHKALPHQGNELKVSAVQTQKGQGDALDLF